MPRRRMIRHLYVHIPFCPRVCPYCSFYKEASDRNKTQGFLDAVLSEAERWSDQLQPHTIFFGGGTPSALSTPQLIYLLSGLHERLDFSQVSEWTLEMNPATVSLEKACELRRLGVNRISMGVQAWDAPSLEVLGRVHTADQAERSYGILREAGFSNVNLDLMFGVPGQSGETWQSNVQKTIGLDPEHISAYCLTYEEDTEFFRRFELGDYGPDEDRDAALFERTIDLLEAGGFGQYEISNYARPSRECLHNLAYWEGAEYVGLGPSAVTTASGERQTNVSDTSAYVTRIAAGVSAAEEIETIDATTHERERLAFGLRTRRGARASLSIATAAKAARLVDEGLLVAANGNWTLTRRGRMVADEVAAELWE